MSAIVASATRPPEPGSPSREGRGRGQRGARTDPRQSCILETARMSGHNDGNATPSRRYLLVSQFRNEGRFIRRTLNSVVAELVPPAAWSSSTTAQPTRPQPSWPNIPTACHLRVVRRRGPAAKRGAGRHPRLLCRARNCSAGGLQPLCKLDTDLELPLRYFELLITRMERDPRIGTGSGKPWFRRPSGGALVPEICGDQMSAGMNKFYRVACFEEIGGFVPQAGTALTVIAPACSAGSPRAWMTNTCASSTVVSPAVV